MTRVRAVEIWLGGRGPDVVGGAKVLQVAEGVRGWERSRTWWRRKADLVFRRVVEVSIFVLAFSERVRVSL